MKSDSLMMILDAYICLCMNLLIIMMILIMLFLKK